MTQQTGIRRELEAAPTGAAGASLRQAVEWRTIKWKRVNSNVCRLQRRIVQAQQRGNKASVAVLHPPKRAFEMLEPCAVKMCAAERAAESLTRVRRGSE